jgi:hypothetical protein
MAAAPTSRAPECLAAVAATIASYKARNIAAPALEVVEPDIEFAERIFPVLGKDRGLAAECGAGLPMPSHPPEGLEIGLYEVASSNRKSRTSPTDALSTRSRSIPIRERPKCYAMSSSTMSALRSTGCPWRARSQEGGHILHAESWRAIRAAKGSPTPRTWAGHRLDHSVSWLGSLTMISGFTR